MSIELKPEEQKLRDDVQIALDTVRETLMGSLIDDEKAGEQVRKMGEMAHQLHLELKQRGNEPKHHAYMIENRGLSPDHDEFYMHVHPVEDLLAFIDDPHANDDPVDQTVGDEFSFTVDLRRWGHPDTYKLTRTDMGWDVAQATHRGPCDKTGHPVLYSNFTNDQVYYPSALKRRLEWVWNQAAEHGLTHDNVQDALDQLAHWVKSTTENAPSGDIWEGC